MYVLSDIPQGARRGGHAARSQHRFLVGLSGQAAVVLDDGRATAELELRRGDTVHVAPGRMEYVNMNYFNPQETSPDAATNNYTATVGDKLTLGGGLPPSS